MIQRIKRIGKIIHLIYGEIRQELLEPSNIGFHSLRLWKRGFPSVAYFMYDFKNNSSDDYLSHRARQLYGRSINGPVCDLLGNKLAFHLLFRNDYCDFLPIVFGTITRGRYTSMSGNSALIDVLEHHNKIVLKPVRGSGGLGVNIVGIDNNKLVVNGKVFTIEMFNSLIKGLNGYIVTEYINQASYAYNIFPKSTNTLRILTMWDLTSNEPFIAVAVHRFGTTESIPVDNWCRGGVCSLVDLESAILGPCIAYPKKRKLIWSEFHPDTGKRIAGCVVPNWDIVVSNILTMAQSVPYIPYIGWDVVVTETGFRVIEGNANSDVDLLQVHKPLLVDPKIREFYRSYGMKGV